MRETYYCITTVCTLQNFVLKKITRTSQEWFPLSAMTQQMIVTLWQLTRMRFIFELLAAQKATPLPSITQAIRSPGIWFELSDWKMLTTCTLDLVLNLL